MKLYSFFFSSASFRVRIALNLKGVSFETIGINLRTGDQLSSDYVGKVSPSALVPVLDTGSLKISQSLAIIDWLEREYPSPQLIPTDPILRAKVLALTNIISCDIHPLNNPRVLKYVTGPLEGSDQDKQVWYEHWIETGFKAVHELLENENGAFCFGDEPTIADCVLIPQVLNSLRWNCDMTAFPRAMEIYNHAMQLDAFAKAAPLEQPDAAK